MHAIAKTFLLAPSVSKWEDFTGSSGFAFFRGLNPAFDRLIDLITDIYEQTEDVPTLSLLQRELRQYNDREVLNYIEHLLSDSTVEVFTHDKEFLVGLSRVRSETALGIANGVVQKWQGDLSGEGGLYPDRVKDATKGLILGLQQTLHRLDQSETAISLRMHGEEAYDRMLARYNAVEVKRDAGVATTYKLPFAGFRNAVDYGPGDMIIIVGYTSQCKSVVAREIDYKSLIEDQLNVLKISTEMPAEDVELLFAMRHANNKRIFPGTPKIPTRAFMTASLTEEQRDFYFQAYHDFCTNDAYGSLHVEQPAHTQFNLSDLADRCARIENDVMPLHVVSVDYLAQLNPLAHGARSRGDNRTDVNRMFAEFRNFGLSYRRRDGEPAPLILITPAQISRGKYQEAVRNDGIFESPDVATDWPEIERSASIMVSTFMTREMRADGRLRLQVLKNRMGEVPVEAEEVMVALKYGTALQEIHEPTDDELSDQLAQLGSMNWAELATV